MRFEEVLSKITPSKKEEAAINADTKRIVAKLQRIKDATIIVGGSDAKGTVIRKDKRDIDIFVAFDYKKHAKKEKQISNILEKELKKLGIKVTIIHGSRDYFHCKGKYGIFEIVPIIKISKANEALNLTDASPLHVTYVKKHTSKNKKLGDEIRLAKSFCYAHDCYGAESYINAFSGYALELLVIHYGSFQKFVNAAAKWPQGMHKQKIIIDPAKHYKNKDAILFQLNESKLLSPLVLVDPLHKERNAAAALSKEQFMNFIVACKKFARKPSAKAFEKKKLTREMLLRSTRGKEQLFTATLSLEKIKTSEDIVGAKLKRLFDFVCDQAERKDFLLKRKEFVFDPENLTVYLHFIVRNPFLPAFKEQQGPPIALKEAVKAFKKKWKRTTTRSRRLYTKVPREFTIADKLLRKLLGERLKSQKLLKIVKRVKWQK